MFRSSPRVVLPRVSPRVARLLLALLFFVHGFSGPFPGCFVHGFSGPFPGCFSFFTAIWLVFHPPTIHTLGLKASGVHDHCKRRRSGHRKSNLLNTLNVKDLQNVTMCILPSSTHCTSSHGLPNILTQRFAKHSVSNGLPSIPAQARHSDLERSRARGRPHTLEFCCTVWHSY